MEPADNVAMLQHFAEHRPHLEPFSHFNELTLDTGVASVTRRPDGTLLVESGDGVTTTIVQWQHRLHINYQARIDESIMCFKAWLSPRFCKNGENRVAWRFLNMFDNDEYMQQQVEAPPIDNALIDDHPWHANSESYVPLSGNALESWYIPAEWADRLNAMPGPQRNELMDRHRKRIETVVTNQSCGGDVTSFASLTHKERHTRCTEAAQQHAQVLEVAMANDIDHMKRWAFSGFCEMVGRAKRASAHLLQLDEGRLVAKSQWVLPSSSWDPTAKLFINLAQSTTLTLCNASTEPWSLHGKNFVGSLAPAQTMQFQCDADGRVSIM